MNKIFLALLTLIPVMAFASPGGTFNLPTSPSPFILKGSNEIPISRDGGSDGAASVDFIVLGMGDEQQEGNLNWGANDSSDQTIALDGAGIGKIFLLNPEGSSAPVIGAGALEVTYLPLLITGDSISGTKPFSDPNKPFRHYDYYLIDNAGETPPIATSVDVLANVTRQGRGLFYNTWGGNMHSLVQEIHRELAANPDARFVANTAGDNDFFHMPPAEHDIEDFKAAVREVSAAIEQAGAKPIWIGIGIGDAIHSRPGWTNANTIMAYEFDDWLENEHCGPRGYGFIDYHTEFMSETASYVDKDGNTQTASLYEPVLDPLYWRVFDAPERAHLNDVGAEKLAGLIEAEIIAMASGTNGAGVISLDKTRYTASEQETFNLIVQRSGGTEGVVSVNYTVTPASLVDGSNSGTLTWQPGNADDQIVSIEFSEVASQQIATIDLDTPTGTPAPSFGDTASAEITVVDAYVPGQASALKGTPIPASSLKLIGDAAGDPGDNNTPLVVNENESFTFYIRRGTSGTSSYFDGAAQVWYLVGDYGNSISCNNGETNVVFADAVWPLYDAANVVKTINCTAPAVNQDTDYEINFPWSTSSNGGSGSITQPHNPIIRVLNTN